MKLIVSAVLLGLVLLFTNCATQKQHTYYLQNPHVISLFKEKHEICATGFVAGANHNQASGFNAACSVTEKYALAVGYMSFQNSGNTSINGVSTGRWSGSFYDLAFARYKDFKNLGVFEIYGGLSYGTQKHDYSIIQEEWKAAFFIPVLSQTVIPVGSAIIGSSRLYVQPNYGFSWNAIDIAVSARISYYSLFSVQNNVQQGTDPYKEIQYLRGHQNHLFIEPAITFRAGWKYGKFQMQWAYSGGGDIKMSNTIISVGAQLAVASRFWKKSNKISD